MVSGPWQEHCRAILRRFQSSHLILQSPVAWGILLFTVFSIRLLETVCLDISLGTQEDMLDAPLARSRIVPQPAPGDRSERTDAPSLDTFRHAIKAHQFQIDFISTISNANYIPAMT